MLAILREVELRKEYLGEEVIETIYFGGGTPSLLDISDIRQILDTIKTHFQVDIDAELTLEANPDDIGAEKLELWKSEGINRLSIGVQSFLEEDLVWMNRAHTANQSSEALELAKKYFSNISIDLIYGTPSLSNEKWKYNVDRAIELNIPHLSCYALTVEPKTPLHKLIEQQRSANVNPDTQSEQFLLLMNWLTEAGYEHYEISNFAKPGWRSRHNSSYWQGKLYLGLGPSAHSFNGDSRQWNISNNNAYISAIKNGTKFFEKELLTDVQKNNEYIMTSLRTVEGLDLKKLGTAASEVLKASKKFVDSGLIRMESERLLLTKEGKLLADGIASDLFV